MIYKYLTLATILIANVSLALSQVTIGNNEAPENGALLQLKNIDGVTDNSVNATKGLGLPRVELTDINNLYPMFTDDGTSGYKIGSTSYTKADEDEKHIGLVVYNINQCTPKGKGIHVWNKEKWVALNPTRGTTIREWAIIAGFSETEIDDVENNGTNSRVLTTGIQLHRDQDGNLFLSSNFGANATDSDVRWMINNLAAKKYDTDQTYTGASGNTIRELIPYDTDGTPSSGILPCDINGAALKKPYYAYPNGGIGGMNSATYELNPRLGLFYSWDAATAGKGGNTGTLNYDNTTTGNPSNNESGFPNGNGTGNTEIIRQGICPNGWHLPSDYEWTDLERNIINYQNQFSNLPTNISQLSIVVQPTPGTDGYIGERGLVNNVNGYGNAMKEICEPSAYSYAKGASNSINSSIRPGFDVFLSGFANNGVAIDFGGSANFWSASSYPITNNNDSAWYRLLHAIYSTVTRDYNFRYDLFSVRCKKD